jgi:hypothetical protein
MWDEIGTFIEANLRSKFHRAVHQGLLELRGKDPAKEPLDPRLQDR